MNEEVRALKEIVNTGDCANYDCSDCPLKLHEDGNYYYCKLNRDQTHASLLKSEEFRDRARLMLSEKMYKLMLEE